MYNSEDSNKNQHNYRWAQPFPKFKSSKPDIHCNGKPCKTRHWRDSRESAANMAHKWARSTDFLLSTLDDNFLIFKGAILNPDKTLEDWRQFKIVFNRYRRRWEQSTGCTMAIVAKQHITIKRGQVDGYKDDMHYDYIGYTDAPLTIEDIRELILSWVDKSGGNRQRSACKRIEDRSSDNLQTLCDYNFKSPNTKAIQDKFLKFAPLSSTKLPVTWVMGDFWRCTPQVTEGTVYWNDELITKERKLSPMDQVWLNWIKSVCGDEIPRFTTEDYRIKITADKLAEAEILWEAFLNNAPETLFDEEKHPITIYVRNSDISPSETPLQINENTVNNDVKIDVIRQTLKNTLQSRRHSMLDSLTDKEIKEMSICFDGYALRPLDNGRYSLMVGKKGKFYDPESIVDNNFHEVDGEFSFDQVERIVEGLGHNFHTVGSLQAPWHKMLKQKQKERQANSEAS
jgi:hypothetical protein